MVNSRQANRKDAVPVNKEFVNMLAQRMKDNDLTQAGLASESGLNQSVVSNIMRGKREFITQNTYNKITAVFSRYEVLQQRLDENRANDEYSATDYTVDTDVEYSAVDPTITNRVLESEFIRHIPDRVELLDDEHYSAVIDYINVMLDDQSAQQRLRKAISTVD